MKKSDLDIYIGIRTMALVDALKKIDNNTLGVLFVVDEDNKLIGALSDGDIRRWLIKTGELKSKICEVMNSNPKYVCSDQKSAAREILEKNCITALPIVDEQMHIVDVFANKVLQNRKQEKLKHVPVVMMAGGKGTRLYPYTKILPKPLIPVGEKPIAELILESFCDYGCKDFFLVVNHKKNMIKAYFNEIDKEYNIFYLDEEKPLGTGGGVGLLKGLINDTFVLTNCDNIVEEDYVKIYEYHKAHGNMITMICALKTFSIPYGVVNLEDEGTIKSMEEKPTFSFFTNTGCYIVEPEIIEEIPEDTFIGFPDIIQKCKSLGKKVGVYPISEQAWLDMGELDSLESMRKHLEKKR